MKTKVEIFSEIQRLMNELVANQSAAFVTLLVTYSNKEQTELNAEADRASGQRTSELAAIGKHLGDSAWSAASEHKDCANDYMKEIK